MSTFFGQNILPFIIVTLYLYNCDIESLYFDLVCHNFHSFPGTNGFPLSHYFNSTQTHVKLSRQAEMLINIKYKIHHGQTQT